MSSSKPTKRFLINTPRAPAAIGPYNQAVLVDKTLYISGQLGLHPKTMALVGGGVKAQAHQALVNMSEILKAAHGSMKDVIKTTVLLKNISDFAKVNEIYADFFDEHQPARAAFQVASLPKDGLVEIEAVAVIGATTAGSVLQCQ